MTMDGSSLQPGRPARFARPPREAGQSDSPNGFSLIELLIVVAIILIIAAIAIPNFMRSRMLANEAAAVASCRNLTTAEVVYASIYSIGYSANLLVLGGSGPVGPGASQLVDDVLASGLKSGYVFTYVATDLNGDGAPDVYTLNANPANPGVSGDRSFFTDQTGVIRWRQGGPASVADPPID